MSANVKTINLSCALLPAWVYLFKAIINLLEHCLYIVLSGHVASQVCVELHVGMSLCIYWCDPWQRLFSVVLFCCVCTVVCFHLLKIKIKMDTHTHTQALAAYWPLEKYKNSFSIQRPAGCRASSPTHTPLLVDFKPALVERQTERLRPEQGRERIEEVYKEKEG